MFKMALAFPSSIANDRVLAAQRDAKLALMHAKTVVDCSVAYANQAKNPLKRQGRLNAPVVLQAQRKAFEAAQQAELLERAVKQGR